ncbi:riboflavin synthase subunit beta [uncultured Algibacter sp.]|uniref:riboflavin synthase subunit beta n=1 Tax=uncultured Algibacter sp. TaxID=298659 RepID=UPI0032179506
MGILKTRKNKKFSYEPRYFDDKGQGNPFEIKHKFDEFRKTVGANKGLKTKFNDAIEDLNNKDQQVNKRVLVIVGILILIFLYLIDFDLSIFFSR